METSEGAAPEVPQVVFRANKRRKVYRQRDREDDDAHTPETTQNSAADPTESKPKADRQSSPDEEGLSVAEALRLRNARKAARLRGVEFKAGREGSAQEEDTNPERALVPADPDPLVSGGAKRFAPQTGLVGELVNKHMEEYIESQLAKRHAAEQGALGNGPDGRGGEASGPGGVTKELLPALPPAKAGKLQEIDLGDEARARNVAMTEMARRRLEGLGADEEAASGSSRPQKPRLGPDGKPWRGRKRRGSDDIKRDRLVEEFLRENTLDVYDLEAQKQGAQALEGEEDGAADDRIAEEFRREFMEAMSDRVRRRRPAAQASKPGAKKDEEVLRGPKLGGSRNVRSAMRDLLLQQQEAGKKRR